MVRSLKKTKTTLALTSLAIAAVASTVAPSVAYAAALYSPVDGVSLGHPGGVVPTRFSSSRPKLTPEKGGGGGGACTGDLTYGGGPVISKIEIVAVYWGSVDAAVTGWAPNYLTTLAASPYVDQLSEYNTVGVSGGTNQKIVRGTFKGAYSIKPNNTSTTLSDQGTTQTDIGTELAAQISAGKLPTPTYDAAGAPNTLFVVFFAPGITIQNSGGSSCANGGFCGYHENYLDNSSKVVPYAVIPDMSSGSGCDQGCAATGTSELDTVAGTVSHEVAEAITDVDVGDNNIGWYDSSGSQSCQGEIADLCADGGPDATAGSSMTSTVSGITVQALWSNKNKKCEYDDPSVPPQTTGCATNSDCSGSTPTCNTTSGACVGCLSNSNCSGATPVCNTSTNTCGGCTSNSDCSSPTGTCATGSTDPNKGKCVACTSNSECSGSTPICGTNDACGGCTSDSQCTESGKTKCDSTGACVAPPTSTGGDAGTGTGTGGGAGTGTGTGTGTGGDAGTTGPGTGFGGDAGTGPGTGEDDAGTGDGAGGVKHTPLPVTSGGCAVNTHGDSDGRSANGLAFGALAIAAMLGLRRRRH